MKPMTGEEVRKWLGTRGILLVFACRKGRADRMPMTPVHALYPWKKAPLLYGFVAAITRDNTRVKVEDGSGGYGWVSIEDVLFQADEL